MKKQIIKDSLIGEWVHSKEEDTDDEIVYRPPSYDFPLTRAARDTYQFSPDGRVIKGKPSGSDGINEIDGSWNLESNEIFIYKDEKLVTKETVASIAKDKLVIKK